MPDVDILEIESPPDDVNVVHDFVEGAFLKHPEIADTAKFEFETAVIEVATNIFRHGPKHSRPVRCSLLLEARSHFISAEFRDQAGCFNAELLDTLMPDPLAESGRGIPLVRVLVDEFTYSRVDGWNTWTLRKAL